MTLVQVKMKYDVAEKIYSKTSDTALIQYLLIHSRMLCFIKQIIMEINRCSIDENSIDCVRVKKLSDFAQRLEKAVRHFFLI